MKKTRKNTTKDMITSSSINKAKGNEKHVIEGVPYVSQETNFYCAYACPTMILKYYGIKTSLQEVLYNSGVGYLLVYPSILLKYFPVSGYLGSQWLADRKFLASLYGLSYENWKANSTLSDEECWNDYWSKVKQNITKDIPVKTAVNVNQIYLPSEIKGLQQLFRFNINILSEFMWKLIPSGIHDIVLVGFDEREGKVCYNDPQHGLWGKPCDGTYVWMNLKNLRKAVSSVKIGKFESKYSIEVFKKTSSAPLRKKEAFEKAHKRNIEKMKGNPSAYDKRYRHCALGINALKLLKKDLERGMQNHSKLLSVYKRTGLKLHFFQKINDFILDRTYYDSNISNVYGCIAIEKQTVFQYLDEKINLSSICHKEKRYLQCEIENWKNLVLYFSEFIEKNIFMRKSKALNIIKNMNYTIDRILSIENKIIND